MKPRPRAVRWLLPLLAVGLLTGCAADSTAARSGSPAVGAVAVVVGAHANAVAPKAGPDVLDLLGQAVEHQADAAVIVNSGQPAVAAQGPLRVSANNSFAAEQEKAQVVGKLADAIRSARATAPETDLLAALDLAARSVADSSGGKVVVVIDSGLQTAGSLRFQDEGLLLADPQEVADFVEKSGSLPRLDGVEVVFSGLGDTAAPQAALAPAQRANLVGIWTAVVERAGGRVRVLQAPLSGSAPTGLPAVSVVDVATPVLDVQQPEIELREEAVGFLPGQATYRDAAAAEGVLRPLAARILRDGLRVHLTGATASAGTVQYRADLSLARADAVKASLVTAGVPAERITTRGVGSDWPRYVPDVAADGTLLPGPAARNRMVLVELSRA